MTMNKNTECKTKKWAVVDDDLMLLDMMNNLLEKSITAEVEIYDNPIEALAAIRRDPEAYEVIITDRNMPQMDGVGLLVLVREVAPHLRFLLMTGNMLNLAREMELFDLPYSCLAKPFGMPALKTAISKAQRISDSPNPKVAEVRQMPRLSNACSARLTGFTFPALAIE
ncbi:response regulator [bacterium]|nr:response regulator [bacterium]